MTKIHNVEKKKRAGGYNWRPARWLRKQTKRELQRELQEILRFLKNK